MHRYAFTLVEMLSVITVMGILMGVVAPALPGILSGRGVSATLDRVSGMVDFARAEAVAKNTYVWLGLQNAAPDGNEGLQVGAVRSLDGTPNLKVNGVVNYASIAAPTLAPGAVLASYPTGVSTDLATKLSKQITVDKKATFDLGASLTPSNPSTSIPIFTMGNKTFTGPVILFTPQGQALLFTGTTPSAVTPYTSQIVIGVCGVHGTTPVQNDPRSGVLLLHGGTGQVSTLRL